MSLLDFFKRNNQNTASIAKERLQIIVAHERNQQHRDAVNLQQLKQKLINVISEHLNIDSNEVVVELERDQDRSILELNVTLPEPETVN